MLPRTERVKLGRRERRRRGAERAGATRASSRSAAIDVDGLRPYRPGTPASRIHWPALARGAGLLERRLRADGDTPPAGRARRSRRRARREQLDAAVRAAASLALELGAPGGLRAAAARRAPRRSTVEPDLVALAGRPRPAGAGRGRARDAGARRSAAGRPLGPVLYVAAQPARRGCRRARRRRRRGPPCSCCPSALADGSRHGASFEVAGCRGFVVGARRGAGDAGARRREHRPPRSRVLGRRSARADGAARAAATRRADDRPLVRLAAFAALGAVRRAALGDADAARRRRGGCSGCWRWRSRWPAIGAGAARARAPPRRSRPDRRSAAARVVACSRVPDRRDPVRVGRPPADRGHRRRDRPGPLGAARRPGAVHGINEWVRIVILLGAAVLLLDAGAAAGVRAARARRRPPRRRGAAADRARGRARDARATRSLPYLHGLILFALLACFMWGERVRAATAAAARAGRVRRGRRGRDGRSRRRSTSTSRGSTTRRWPAASRPAHVETFDWTQRYGPLIWPRTGNDGARGEGSAACADYWKAENLDSFDGRGLGRGRRRGGRRRRPASSAAAHRALDADDPGDDPRDEDHAGDRRRVRAGRRSTSRGTPLPGDEPRHLDDHEPLGPGRQLHRPGLRPASRAPPSSRGRRRTIRATPLARLPRADGAAESARRPGAARSEVVFPPFHCQRRRPQDRTDPTGSAAASAIRRLAVRRAYALAQTPRAHGDDAVRVRAER